jgi:hypothetical protein
VPLATTNAQYVYFAAVAIGLNGLPLPPLFEFGDRLKIGDRCFCKEVIVSRIGQWQVLYLGSVSFHRLVGCQYSWTFTGALFGRHDCCIIQARTTPFRRSHVSIWMSFEHPVCVAFAFRRRGKRIKLRQRGFCLRVFTDNCC